jgi:hypothetical protein
MTRLAAGNQEHLVFDIHVPLLREKSGRMTAARCD